MISTLEVSGRAMPTIPEGGVAFFRKWFALARLAWVGASAAGWWLAPQRGPWIVALAAIPWVVNGVLTREMWRRTPFDLPLLFFLVTAGASLAVAYDPQGAHAPFPTPVGWAKLWGLVLAALIFHAVASLESEAQRRWTVSLFSVVGPFLALWLVASVDWGATPATGTLVARLGRLAQAALRILSRDPLNANVAGGLLVLALPMNLELASWPAGSGRMLSYVRIAWGLVSSALTGLALLLTGSRGAWLGAAAALSLTGAWWLAGRTGGGRRRIAVFSGFVAAGALVGGLAFAAVPQIGQATIRTETAANRIRIFSQAALLVRDYAFTGCGLGQFPLVHSTYAVLIHVPTLVFAHNTPLAVATEQGLPAAVMLLALWTGVAWLGLRALADSTPAPAGLQAGLLSLAVVVTHGMFDNVIYGTRALPALWLPVGLIVAGSTGVAESPRREGLARRRWWGLVGTAAAAVALAVSFWRPLAAAWQANLGAVRQTLTELQTYDWQHFDNPTLDEVRRRADLSTAVAHFERALTTDPGQVTARTRLAQISLAQGAYDEALAHAEAAWQAGHRDRVTRLVLGEAMVAHGLVDEGARVVRGLEWAEGRFDGQAYYRYWVNEDWQRAAYAWEAVLRLDPENARVKQALRRAEEMIARGSDT